MILAEGQFYQSQLITIRGHRAIELCCSLSDKTLHFDEKQKSYQLLIDANNKNIDVIGEAIWTNSR